MALILFTFPFDRKTFYAFLFYPLMGYLSFILTTRSKEPNIILGCLPVGSLSTTGNQRAVVTEHMVLWPPKTPLSKNPCQQHPF